MGWGGPFLVDGREVGYNVEAECDAPDCQQMIDRGLGYLCGDMHGESGDEGSWGCGDYFCEDHIAQWRTSEDGYKRGHTCLGPMNGAHDHEFEPDPDNPETCGRTEHHQFFSRSIETVCGYDELDHTGRWGL